MRRVRSISSSASTADIARKSTEIVPLVDVSCLIKCAIGARAAIGPNGRDISATNATPNSFPVVVGEIPDGASRPISVPGCYRRIGLNRCDGDGERVTLSRIVPIARIDTT